ncbi:MAG: nucleotide exchange factor GrpE [Bryobacteraceae bacterium]
MSDPETPQGGGNGATQAEDAYEPGGEIIETPESITLERDRLALEKTELQNALLRLAAEFDNSRKRVERERAELYEFAAADAVKALLPVLDDFERALQAHPGGHGKTAELVKGVELIYQHMVDILTKLGLQPIAAQGQPFDPNLHHAIEMVRDERYETPTVVEELQRGYTLKGRLLRPAMVRVAGRE